MITSFHLPPLFSPPTTSPRLHLYTLSSLPLPSSHNRTWRHCPRNDVIVYLWDEMQSAYFFGNVPFLIDKFSFRRGFFNEKFIGRFLRVFFGPSFSFHFFLFVFFSNNIFPPWPRFHEPLQAINTGLGFIFTMLASHFFTDRCKSRWFQIENESTSASFTCGAIFILAPILFLFFIFLKSFYSLSQFHAAIIQYSPKGKNVLFFLFLFWYQMLFWCFPLYFRSLSEQSCIFLSFFFLNLYHSS